MSQTTKKEKKPKQKKKMDAASWIIVIGLILIAIPCVAFAYILLSASAATGTVISGDRFTNDLDPAITEEQLAAVDTAVESIEGVESADVYLKSGTVRVYLNTIDEMTPEVAEDLANQAYDKLIQECDPSVYFTQSS